MEGRMREELRVNEFMTKARHMVIMEFGSGQYNYTAYRGMGSVG